MIRAGAGAGREDALAHAVRADNACGGARREGRGGAELSTFAADGPARRAGPSRERPLPSRAAPSPR